MKPRGFDSWVESTQTKYISYCTVFFCLRFIFCAFFFKCCSVLIECWLLVAFQPHPSVSRVSKHYYQNMLLWNFYDVHVGGHGAGLVSVSRIPPFTFSSCYVITAVGALQTNNNKKCLHIICTQNILSTAVYIIVIRRRKLFSVYRIYYMHAKLACFVWNGPYCDVHVGFACCSRAVPTRGFFFFF